MKKVMTRGALLGWCSVLAAVPVLLTSLRVISYLVELANTTGGLGRYAGQMWVAALGAVVARHSADLGRSSAMQAIARLVDRVAKTAQGRIGVLILGESGVGKEVVARAIHARSSRASRPFVKLNCAAIQADLCESELFGHEKGAFTDARAQRRGWFEQSDGGTIFLDEVADLPMDVQPKLLHVLQDGQFFRVGGHRPIAVDVQVIAATNSDLRTRMTAGKFREDLYYRLNVIEIRVPPLRERPEDIPVLIDHFRARLAEEYGRPVEIPPATLELFLRHTWPGNVRELENLVHRVALLGMTPDVERLLTPVAVDSVPAADGLRVTPLKQIARLAATEAERAVIVATLHKVSGNRRAAARLLGISERALAAKLYRLGVGLDGRQPGSAERDRTSG